MASASADRLRAGREYDRILGSGFWRRSTGFIAGWITSSSRARASRTRSGGRGAPIQNAPSPRCANSMQHGDEAFKDPAVPPRLSPHPPACAAWGYDLSASIPACGLTRRTCASTSGGAFFRQPLLSAFTVISPSRASTLPRVAVGKCAVTGLSRRGLSVSTRMAIL